MKNYQLRNYKSLMKLSTSSWCLFLFSFCILFFGSCFPEPNESSNEALDNYLVDYELIQLDPQNILKQVRSQAGGKIVVDLGVKDLVFEQEEYDLFDENYRETEVLAEGEEVDVTPEEMYFLHNTDLDTEEKVAMTISENHVRVEFTQGNKQLVISPLNDFGIGDLNNDYVLHELEDLIAPSEEHSCGSEELNPNTASSSDEPSFNSLAVIDHRVGMLAVADYQFFQKHKHRSKKYIKRNVYWAGYRYWGYSGISVKPRLTRLRIYRWNNTIATTYSSSQAYCNEWRSWHLSSGMATRDINFLFTGKNMQNHGVAWLGTACAWRDYAYGVVKSISSTVWWRHNVLAHEIGHLLNASHSNSGVMVWDSASDQFNQESKNAINNHCDNHADCF